MTEKQKSLARLLTVGGIILAVIIIVALIYNIVSLVNLNARKAGLEEKTAAMEQIVEENQDIIDYRGSDEYIKRYAMDYLDKMRQNDVAYILLDEE